MTSLPFYKVYNHFMPMEEPNTKQMAEYRKKQKIHKKTALRRQNRIDN